jgi:LacI family transcriptional regulator
VEVSDMTRKKTINVFKNLNSLPTSIGPPLIEKADFTIGILIPNMENPFYVEIAKNIQQRGHELGFRVVMCSTGNESKMELEYTKLLKQNGIAGFILVGGFENDITLQELVDEGLPIVLICQDIPPLKVESVSVDDFLGGYEVTKHLLSLGHQQIAILAEKRANTRVS